MISVFIIPDHGLLNTRPDMSHFEGQSLDASFQKT